ncbi:hypothetical protein D7V91_04625 [bacterium 1xD42-67]|nr:hypothetical protein D7V91_04625 [bacterium 1xD42-67]
MKCLLRYQWVKLPRNQMPIGKGVMGAWARLASRAAFRNGQARYYKYINQVTIGSWAGGIVGLKSILGIKNRNRALETMDRLAQLGYIDYELDPKTKKLTYHIKDWVVQCSGEPCMGAEAVYATQGYGFLCLPRNVTQRLAEAHYHFDESDAWLDLWCHTVWQEPGNAFSHMAPAVQFGKYGAVLTLETLGHRWGWEKTKVWRFFKKHADAFPLQKLPGSFGCLIFNAAYPTGVSISLPESAQVKRILEEIRIWGRNTHIKSDCDHERVNRWIAWYSRKVIPQIPPAQTVPAAEHQRVAVSAPLITRAYFSPCRHCKSFKEDCQGIEGTSRVKFGLLPRAGPKTGPPTDIGGIEYGTFEGSPLW